MQTEITSPSSSSLAASLSNRAGRSAAPLPPGRAVTLQAREDCLLRLRAGRLWLTRDASRGGWAEDVVLGAGDQFRVPAGERVVVESWGAEPVFFDWEPAGAVRVFGRPDPYSASGVAPLATPRRALPSGLPGVGALVAGTLRLMAASIAAGWRRVGAAGQFGPEVKECVLNP